MPTWLNQTFKPNGNPNANFGRDSTTEWLRVWLQIEHIQTRLDLTHLPTECLTETDWCLSSI